jgi:uncharacterized membrane protein YkoI
MASTKMFTKNPHTSNSFFHQQSASSTNQNIDEDTTLTQEMHVKMAKKIAQLTKVRRFKLHTFSYLLLSNKREKKKTSTMSSTNDIHCLVQKKRKKKVSKRKLFLYC